MLESFSRRKAARIYEYLQDSRDFISLPTIEIINKENNTARITHACVNIFVSLCATINKEVQIKRPSCPIYRYDKIVCSRLISGCTRGSYEHCVASKSALTQIFTVVHTRLILIIIIYLLF